MAWVRLTPAAGQSDTPIAMATRASRRLVNVAYLAGRYIRRLCVRPLSVIDPVLVATEYLVGTWALKVQPAAGVAVCDVYAGSTGTVASAPTVFRTIGAGLVPLPYNGVFVYGTPTPWFPWRSAELKDTATLLAKRGMKADIPPASGGPPVLTVPSGKLLYQTTTVVTPAGIRAPTVAASMADINGGTLPDGTWSTSYTFVTDDGHESNESPAATVTTVSGGTGQRRWSLLEVSLHPRVTLKNLYLTKQGVDNVTRYFLTQIPNATIGYTETLADSTLGFKTAPITNLLPPNDVEDIVLWDECAFGTTSDPNFGAPGWAYTYVDSDGIPQVEAFDADRRMLRIPPRGGQHPMCAIAWDGDGLQRLALFTDASVTIATPSAQDQVYDTSNVLDPKHGVPGPACAASGAADGGVWLVWFDGFRIRASSGGAPVTISTDAVEKNLRDIPAGMAERACVGYRRSEGGFFSISFASTSTSTTNDLELWWSPADRNGPHGGWSMAYYLSTEAGAGKAPVAYGSAPSEAPVLAGITPVPSPGAIDLAVFSTYPRIFQLDAPVLRDDTGGATMRVYVDLVWAPVVDNDGQQLIAGRAMVAYGGRRDISAVADLAAVTPELSFTLLLDLDTDALRSTTAQLAVRDKGTLHGACHNFGDPARTIELRLSGFCTPAIEFAAAWLDVARVGLRRIS